MAKITYRQNYRSYPFEDQKNPLDRIFGGVRYVKNQSLAVRSFAYKEFGLKLNGSDIKDAIPDIKKEVDAWMAKLPSQPIQEAVIDQDQAFERFFQGLGKYPKRAKKRGRQSFRLTQPRVEIDKENPNWAKLFIPKFGFWLPFKLHKHFSGKVGACTVSKNPDQTYELSFVITKDIQKFKPVKGLKEIGIDIGINHFVFTSDGKSVQAPKPLRANLARLRLWQRSFARMKKKGKNWIKLKNKISKLHSKIARQRKDFLHQLSTKIVHENQVICIEDLAVKNMVKNPRLSRSISDLGWGMFISMLKYKCVWYGRSLRIISRWYPSSKSCNECGFIKEDVTLSDREWDCESCHSHHNRDLNAAINILKVGRDTTEYKPVTTKKLKRLGQKLASDDGLRPRTQAASQNSKETKAGITSTGDRKVS